MKRKLLAVLLTTTIAISSLAGCGSKTNDTSANETARKAQENNETTQTASEAETASKYQTTYGSKQFDNVKITVELFDRSNAPDGSTITDNKWTKYAQEQMAKVGIDLEYIPVSRWDEVTKMQSMVASQTAPDITITYTYAYAEDYYNQGGTWNLNEFIDGADQAQNMKKYIGEGCLDIGRNASGELYGIVAKRATTAKSNLFIRKDWLDALGLAVPTTPDELYDALDKMVHNNPDGRTDVTSRFYQSWNVKNAFSQTVQDPVEHAIAGTEDCISEYYDKGMKDFYRFANKLYNAGILHPEYYTMSEDDFKSYIVTGAMGFTEYNVNGNVDVLRGSLLKTLQENVPTAELVSIPALKNVNDGKQYSQAYSQGGLIAFCPKTASAEVVEACMTYLDWMCTPEGGFVIYHGFENEHYVTDANGIPAVKDAEYNSKDKDWIRTDLFLTGNQGYFATVDDFNACTSKEAPGYEEYVINNYENALTGTILYDSTYTSPSTADLITDLNIVKDEYQVKCITCTPEEFDANWDEYMSALEDAGVQTIIDERTEYFRQ